MLYRMFSAHCYTKNYEKKLRYHIKIFSQTSANFTFAL